MYQEGSAIVPHGNNVFRVFYSVFKQKYNTVYNTAHPPACRNPNLSKQDNYIFFLNRKISNIDLTRKTHHYSVLFLIVVGINELTHAISPNTRGFLGFKEIKSTVSHRQLATTCWCHRPSSFSLGAVLTALVRRDSDTTLNCFYVTQRPELWLIPMAEENPPGKHWRAKGKVLPACSVHVQAIFLRSCKFLIFYIFLKLEKPTYI